MISQLILAVKPNPLNLKKNLFTTAAVDNIDHNPSSATTSDSLHGTGISLFQHRTQEEEGESREDRIPSENKKQKLNFLPDRWLLDCLLKHSFKLKINYMVVASWQ